MRFGVLGPVEVWEGGDRLAVGGPQQRALLAVLLLNANRMVSVDRLVDCLWGSDPPAAARGLLQGCVAGLRRALPSQRIVTRAPGYLLRVEPEELDLDRFDRLAHEAASRTDPERAAELLADALALWRGAALDGIDLDAVRTEAVRLEERRLAVWERRIELDLQLGRQAALIPELRTLVREHPLRERLWAQLMLALYRADRRAEALDTYQRLRQTLVEQLGVEPAAAVRELHRTILAEPRDRPAPATTPAQLPAGLTGFTGRAAQLKQLDELLADPAEGLAIGVLTGPGGIGKTSLAVHWAHTVRDRFPDGQLYADLRGFQPAGQPADPAEVIHGFLDALGTPPDRMPATAQAQASLYRSLLADRRMLVVLDNASGTDQVRPLLPGSPSCLVLVTSRNHLAGLTATDGARPVPLDLLSESDGYRLLARRLGPARLAAEPAAVERILARCAGLPLALAIVAARAAAQPDFPLAAFAADLSSPAETLDSFGDQQDATLDLRSVFSWSYRALDPQAASLFRLLGLHPGPDLGVAAAASLAGVPPAAIRGALADLVGSSLLTQAAPGRYAMHDLLRAYAAELTAPGERHDAMARLLDHLLHTAHAVDGRLYPARELIELPAPAPGAAAIQFTDDQAAAEWMSAELPVLLAAVEWAAGEGIDLHAWRLTWAAGGFLYYRARWRELAGILQTALGSVTRLRDRAAEARVRRFLGRTYTNLEYFDLAESHLRHALGLFTELRDHGGQAHTHHVIAMLLEKLGRIAEAVPHGYRALALHRALSNESGQADALNQLGWYYTRLGQHRRALELCLDARSIFQRHGNRFGEANTLDSLGHAYHALGEHALAVSCYERAAALFRRLDNRFYLAETLDRLGDTHAATGRLEVAQPAWHEAATILDELQMPDADRVHAKLGRVTVG
jgi:DNA-binding SARP family transcriptional activator